MHPARKLASRPVRKASKALARKSQGQAHALELIHAVCCLAGCPSLIDDLRNELVEAGMLDAIETHDTPRLFLCQRSVTRASPMPSPATTWTATAL